MGAKNKLVQNGDLILLNDSTMGEYIFKENYYFVTRDKVMSSRDFRYWGLLVEKFIVGKVTLIWKSVNPPTEEIRWNRVLKNRVIWSEKFVGYILFSYFFSRLARLK